VQIGAADTDGTGRNDYFTGSGLGSGEVSILIVPGVLTTAARIVFS